MRGRGDRAGRVGPAEQAGRPRRAAPAALALGWRAAPLDSALSLAVTVGMGLLPAAAAWTTKLLLDELAAGRAMSVARASWLVVAGAGVTVATTLLTLISGQLSRRVQRSITVSAQSRLYERVNGFAGIGPLDQDRQIVALLPE